MERSQRDPSGNWRRDLQFLGIHAGIKSIFQWSAVNHSSYLLALHSYPYYSIYSLFERKTHSPARDCYSYRNIGYYQHENRSYKTMRHQHISGGGYKESNNQAVHKLFILL